MKRPPLKEIVKLFGGVIAKSGITTLAGAVTGDSFIDASLIGAGANSFVNMLVVLYPGDSARVDSARCTIFNNGNGEVTLEHAYKGVAAALPAGVPYAIVTFPFATPAAIAVLLAALGASGLAYAGTVSGIVGAPNFQCSNLTGLGDDYFGSVANPGYWAYVVWDAAGGGGAPQGQSLVCTGYVSATGNFTVAAFAPVITVGDKVLLIHPSVAYMLGLTPARAALLDNLAAAVSVVGSPYSQPNDLVEHDAIVVAAGIQLVDIELDLSNLAQANTIREKVQTDGANYQQVSAKVFPTDYDPGTKVATYSYPQKNVLYKITMQSSVLEGGAKNVPYRIMTRDLS